ncbi:MAG: MoaD/ThiS family protein, partial [Candidatus Altarchaeaceae archaeon]
MANVKIPSPLRKFTNGKGEVKVEGKNINEIIDNLEKSYPGIKDRIIDEKGEVRKFINIYINGEDIRFLNKLETKVNDNDEILIVPS